MTEASLPLGFIDTALAEAEAAKTVLAERVPTLEPKDPHTPPASDT
nr:unnamed protein product [Digitaria exilis]